MNLGLHGMLALLAAIAVLASCAGDGIDLTSLNHTCSLRVRVLGTGGPMHAEGRGAAAYLISKDDRPLLVIDMGGDTPTALGRAGVRPRELSTLAISHIHPDHVSGVPDYIWGEMTAGRTEALTILGPRSRPEFPNLEEVFQRLFSATGVFPDMSSLIAGAEFPLRFIDHVEGGPAPIVEIEDVRVSAIYVDHGRAPSLAYRLDAGSASIVFAGDQTMNEASFLSFAENADLMFVHAIANRNVAAHELRRVIAQPTSIGSMAQGAEVKHVVVGHLMGDLANGPDMDIWSLNDMSGVMTDIRAGYSGLVTTANDLDEFVVACTD